MAVCDRCGGFTCDGCLLQGPGWVRCFKCGAPSVREPVPGQLTFALVIAAIGMLCAPLSLLGMGLALGWKWGRWKDRTPLERDYVRWAIWVGLLGFALSAGSIMLGFWTATR